MKALTAALVVCLALVSNAAGAAGGGRAPVLGIDWQWPHRALVHVDPLTFRQVGKDRVALGGFANLYGVSPDRELFAGAGQDRPVLRVVDPVASARSGTSSWRATGLSRACRTSSSAVTRGRSREIWRASCEP